MTYSEWFVHDGRGIPRDLVGAYQRVQVEFRDGSGAIQWSDGFLWHWSYTTDDSDIDIMKWRKVNP